MIPVTDRRRSHYFSDPRQSIHSPSRSKTARARHQNSHPQIPEPQQDMPNPHHDPYYRARPSGPSSSGKGAHTGGKAGRMTYRQDPDTGRRHSRRHTPFLPADRVQQGTTAPAHRDTADSRTRGQPVNRTPRIAHARTPADRTEDPSSPPKRPPVTPRETGVATVPHGRCVLQMKSLSVPGTPRTDSDRAVSETDRYARAGVSDTAAMSFTYRSGRHSFE